MHRHPRQETPRLAKLLDERHDARIRVSLTDEDDPLRAEKLAALLSQIRALDLEINMLEAAARQGTDDR